MAMRCAADERQRLEQLCRYITRPALANKRVQCNAAWQVVLKSKTRWRDVTSHILMLPLEFMQRLAALVPRPRLHLTSMASWRRTPNCGRWWCRPDRSGNCRARARVDRVRLRPRPASEHRLGSVAQAGS